MTFRDAHAWLRGYSDAIFQGRAIPDDSIWPDHRRAYLAGFRFGTGGI